MLHVGGGSKATVRTGGGQREGALWAGALAGNFGLALWCSVIVLVEVAILLLNRWRCPLTPLAARYTTDRRANFDIFLPEVVARYNKEIFGTLFVLGMLLAVLRWRLAAG